MAGVDAAQRAFERDTHLNQFVGDGDRQIHRLAIGVLQRDRQRKIEGVDPACSMRSTAD